MSATDEAWQEFKEANPDWWANRTEAGFMAGYRRALEDAAALAGQFNDKGLVPHSFDVAHELRARAAAVAPRETKDNA